MTAKSQLAARAIILHQEINRTREQHVTGVRAHVWLEQLSGLVAELAGAGADAGSTAGNLRKAAKTKKKKKGRK